ncbi:MAG: PEGA domain-containing protein [Deltaproteobacteria bacterium]|nr:PEGA domain-containing protein [Deltaproteobacteria bacterium]
MSARTTLQFGGATLAVILAAATAGAQDLGPARQRHERAVALTQENPPNYNAALTEFEEAYRLLEGHPRRYVELRNIAECYQNLGQYDRALTAFQRYLQEGGPGAEDRPRYEAAIAALESTLGSFDIQVNLPSAEVWVDDRQVGVAPGRVRVPGGRHLVELRASGHSPSRQEAQVASRQTTPLAFTLEVLGRGGMAPVFFWSALGATAVTASVGAVFGVLALSARSDVNTRLASSDDATRFSVGPGDQQRITSLATTADILYASAGVLAVGTAVLYFITDFRGGRAAPAQGSLRLRPLVGPGGLGVGLGGAF